MTPVLQQAIKLLQMSRLELVDRVKQELMENPILDEVEDIEQYQRQQKPEDSSQNEFENQRQEEGAVASLEVIGLEKRAKQDESSINWEDYFADNPSSLGYYGERDAGDPNQTYEAVLSHSQSLTEHLIWQLHMSQLPERMFNICTFLIGQIDDDGYIHYEAPDTPETADHPPLISTKEDAETHRRYVLEVLQQKLNVEFERNYLLSVLNQESNHQKLFSILLSQDYYEDFSQRRYDRLLEKLQALTFGQIEIIGKLICDIPGDELENCTGIPAAEITAALTTIQKICRDLHDVVEQHFAALLKDQYDAKLRKLEMSVEELYLVEYLLLHLSAEEIAYVASREQAAKAVKREHAVRDFLEKLRQSYAHVEQLQSHKYFLIQLYRIGAGILFEHLKEHCPPRYQKLCVKLSPISPEMIAEAEAHMQALLQPFHQENVPIALEEVEHALRHIQTFTPAGAGARDLQECLLIQARNLGIVDPLLESIIHGHLKDIQQRRYGKIADTLSVPRKEVELVANIIANMSPRPGGDFSSHGLNILCRTSMCTRLAINTKLS
jgi:DNA-directed RNA polymerase specialized sigma54-like protein